MTNYIVFILSLIFITCRGSEEPAQNKDQFSIKIQTADQVQLHKEEHSNSLELMKIFPALSMVDPLDIPLADPVIELVSENLIPKIIFNLSFPDSVEYAEYAICSKENDKCAPSKEKPFVLFQSSQTAIATIFGDMVVYSRYCVSPSRIKSPAQLNCSSWQSSAIQTLQPENTVNIQNAFNMEANTQAICQNSLRVQHEAKIFLSNLSKKTCEISREEELIKILSTNFLNMGEAILCQMLTHDIDDKLEAILGVSRKNQLNLTNTDNSSNQDILQYSLIGLGIAGFVSSVVAMKYIMNYDPIPLLLNTNKYPVYGMTKPGFNKDIKSFILRNDAGEVTGFAKSGTEYSVEYLKDAGGLKERYGSMDRQSYEVTIDENGTVSFKNNGVIRKKTKGGQYEDVPVNKGQKFSEIFTDRTSFIGVMDGNGRLYMGVKRDLQFQHSSFLAGNPVAGAFSGKMEDGKIKYLSPHSGHYMPSANAFKQLQAVMKLPDIIFNPPVIKTTLHQDLSVIANKIRLKRISDSVLLNRGEKFSDNTEISKVKSKTSLGKKVGIASSVLLGIGSLVTLIVAGQRGLGLSDLSAQKSSCEGDSIVNIFLGQLAKIKEEIDALREDSQDRELLLY